MIAIFSGIRRRWRRPDRRGAFAVEFALTLPVLLMATLGAIEAGHIAYTRAIIYGAVDKAARDLSLESVNTDSSTITGQLENTILQVAPGAVVTPTHTAYNNYSFINNPGEPYADSNGDGRCDNNEVYQDLNNNGQWDADSSTNSVGNARQVVVYTFTTTFPPLFPYSPMIFGTNMFTYTTTTALRNQPYVPNATVPNRSCS